jgi:hypothetical protein
MTRYRVLEKSFINGRVCESGEIVHYVGPAASNLELMDGEVVEEFTAPQLMPSAPLAGIRVRADGKYIAIWCAGCNESHGAIPINGADSAHRWTWDGRTLTPSVRHFHHLLDDQGKQMGEATDCHYNVTNGHITYHADSAAHNLRGEMDLQPFPDGKGPVDGWFP